MELREAQLKHEEETDLQASADKLLELRNAAAEGDLELPRAQAFIASAFGTVRDSIEAALAIKTRGVGGKFKGWLRALPTDIAAIVALRVCISKCASSRRNRGPVTIQALASAIGRLYETEIKIKEAQIVNPLYMKRVFEQVQDRGTKSESHLRRVFDTAYTTVMKGEIDSDLSTADSIQLGKFGVQACMDAGILELHKDSGSKGAMHHYLLSDRVMEYLLDYDNGDVASLVSTSSRAMLCPPDPWTSLGDGGYLSARRKRALPLMGLGSIRRSDRPRIRKLFTAENMPKVFECANYLQSIPYGVHAPTFQAIQKLWEEGGGVLGVPTRSSPTAPVFPFDADWKQDGASEDDTRQFLLWKFAAKDYYDSLNVWRGKVREIGSFLKILKDRTEHLWFPVYVDRRGRWYYRGNPNLQGSDLARACLHFGTRKTLGERGLFWLKVHIANSFGFDKERMHLRAKWTEDNWKAISRALDAPGDHPDVWGTDNPWVMFSAAWELREALVLPDPRLYETGIPVHMDATCSGLQHFSAMLKDPVGGEYVNLTNGDGTGPKRDIYMKVAGVAGEAMALDLQSTDEATASMAGWWATQEAWNQPKLRRDLAKTPVMTYVYSATLRGTAGGITHKMGEALKSIPEGGRMYTYTYYGAKKLFAGIAATVPAAGAGMEWLKAVARQMPKGKRMEWRTPSGFVVQHDYQDFTEKRVDIRSCGQTKIIVREYNDGTRPVPMQNAISPNFVHALDAAHLALTALGMKQLGLAIVTIHDSFGTHPCDVDALQSTVREAFIGMYKDSNIMGDFLWEVGGIGEVPSQGTLDLSLVRQSEFFFS